MFPPIEIKLQNSEVGIISLMFGKFSWSQKQNVYTLRIYKESVSANSCSHDTLLNKFLCDKTSRGKKGKKCGENTKCLYFTLNKFKCPLQISNRFLFETSKKMFCPTFLAHPIEREKMTL